MTELQLFSAIGQIDDKYIEEAAPNLKARPRLMWVRYAAAACLFLAILGAVTFIRKSSYKPTPSLPSASLNQSSEKNNSSVSTQGTENNNVSAEADKSVTTSSDKPGATKGDIGTTAQTSSGAVSKPEATRGENYNYVNITLSNNGYYDYVSESKLKEFGIDTITQNDLGEKIGKVTADNCDDERLIGCEIYRHKPTNCDAFIVVKKGEKLLPFQFFALIEPYKHDFKEILSIYNVGSYEDITHITKELIKSKNTKTITNPQDISSIYDILMSIKSYNDPSPEWLKAEREKNAGNSKTVFLVSLHFKNGLSYRFAYEPYLGEGYINYHEFLTKEQKDTLLSILL